MKKAMYSKGVLIAGLFLAVSFGECTSGLANTVIRVPGSVQVNKAFITLGTIAEIKGEDLQVVELLKAVKLGKAPKPGEMKEIRGDNIETKIHQSGVDPETVTLYLPEKVAVKTESIEISPQEIESIVKKFILQKVPWNRTNVAITVSALDTITLPQGAVTYELSVRKKEDFLGSANIALVFLVDGQAVKKLQVHVTVDVIQEVLVSNRSFKRHDVISQEDVRLEKMNLAKLQTDVITDPGEVIGKRTKRNLDVNTPLRLTFLEMPPLVKRGDMVTIVAETDVLKITTKGVVTESGCKGDMVRVVNVNSRKELFAKVRDARTVEVDF
jgi:flagella basal body P-ring formation protein FlgA